MHAVAESISTESIVRIMLVAVMTDVISYLLNSSRPSTLLLRYMCRIDFIPHEVRLYILELFYCRYCLTVWVAVIIYFLYPYMHVAIIDILVCIFVCYKFLDISNLLLRYKDSNGNEGRK